MSPSSDPHITCEQSSDILAFIGKLSFLCPLILYIYFPFYIKLNSNILTLASMNLILESLLVIIATFTLRKSIDVTFLPFENFPLLFLQITILKGLSFSYVES